MRTKIVRVSCLVIMVLSLCSIITAVASDPNSADPNSTAPRQIVMPKNTKMPDQYKCPVHGNVTQSLLVIEIDQVKQTYCKKCAMQLVVDIFDLNLPKLEVISENP